MEIFVGFKSNYSFASILLLKVRTLGLKSSIKSIIGFKIVSYLISFEFFIKLFFDKFFILYFGSIIIKQRLPLDNNFIYKNQHN